jgi:predicted secreted protein
MSIFTAIVVFVLVWWVVLFMVLPWGVRHPEEAEAGHEPGAPVNPRVWVKLAVTTVVASVISGIIYWVILADLISFRFK